MNSLTEVKDFNIIKVFSSSKTGGTYLAANKAHKNDSEENFKVLKLKVVDGKHYAQFLVLKNSSFCSGLRRLHLC